MKSEYYPPTHMKKSFHCPLCNVYANQQWNEIYIKGSYEGFIKVPFMSAHCDHCGDRSFWYGPRMIVPSEAPVSPAHPDLPTDCRAEYDEARDIMARSPRAASALLRLVIQKLMKHLGQPGKNINSDIKALVVGGLPPLVQKALDFCRVVGNNAVHPGEIDLNDTPETAHKLFQMINFIVQDRITHPKEIEALYAELPEEAREAIDRRDERVAPTMDSNATS